MSRSKESAKITPKANLILASGSQSRKEMLEEAGIAFDVVVSSADEENIKSKIASLKRQSRDLSISPFSDFK